MNYLVLQKNRNGYYVFTRTPEEHNLFLYGYTARNAEKKFRQYFGYVGKHFTKLYC